ncbi:MAG: glycosyltransferase family 39 protein [Candidatus Omnitrophica bacterium]|nr:glycosyltransferase family 39 protein [Candidatus Omnitrophota bacterium]
MAKKTIFFRKIQFKNNWDLLSVLFFAAFFIRLAFLAACDNLQGAGPMLNIITALHVFKSPSLLENIYYGLLPLYLYSLALAVNLGTEQILSAQFLSLFFGSFSAVPFYLLIRRFSDKKIAFYAAMFFCCYPAHINASILSMPEAVTLCLLLWATYYILNYSASLAALFLALACGFSYLAWLFIPIFITIYLSCSQKAEYKWPSGRIRTTGERNLMARRTSFERHHTIALRIEEAILIFFICTIFPLIWVKLVAAKYNGCGIFYKNFYEARSFLEFIFAFTDTVRMLMSKLFNAPLPLFFVFGLAGLYQSARLKKFYPFIFIVGMLVLLSSINIFREDIFLLDGIILIAGVFYIPFIIEGIMFIMKTLFLKINFFSKTLILLSVLLLLGIGMYDRPYLPKRVKVLSSWIKDNIGTQDIIFINKDSNGYYTSVIMLSGLPQGNFFAREKEQSLEIKRLDSTRSYFVILDRREKEINFTESWEKVYSQDAYAIYRIL